MLVNVCKGYLQKRATEEDAEYRLAALFFFLGRPTTCTWPAKMHQRAKAACKEMSAVYRVVLFLSSAVV